MCRSPNVAVVPFSASVPPASVIVRFGALKFVPRVSVAPARITSSPVPVNTPSNSPTPPLRTNCPVPPAPKSTVPPPLRLPTVCVKSFSESSVPLPTLIAAALLNWFDAAVTMLPAVITVAPVNVLPIGEVNRNSPAPSFTSPPVPVAIWPETEMLPAPAAVTVRPAPETSPLNTSVPPASAATRASAESATVPLTTFVPVLATFRSAPVAPRPSPANVRFSPNVSPPVPRCNAAPLATVVAPAPPPNALPLVRASTLPWLIASAPVQFALLPFNTTAPPVPVFVRFPVP